MIVVTLRERLRLDTRTSNEAVDRAYRPFDLTTARGLGGFLAAQRIAAASLAQVADGPESLADDLAATLDDIDADLGVLGRAVPDLLLPRPVADHPIARSYVWYGSRLGMKMLARRWDRATDPAVVAAGAFVARLAERPDWRPVAEALDALSGRGRVADAATRATRDWFAVLEQAAVGVRRRAAADA